LVPVSPLRHASQKPDSDDETQYQLSRSNICREESSA